MSAGGVDWALLNASPDIRQQILATPELHPRPGGRNSPVRAVVLASGEVDAIAGLLSLRERQAFDLLATARVHDVLAANPIFAVLDPALVSRIPVRLGKAFQPVTGLEAELFAVPGKVALYLEGERPEIGHETEDTVGVRMGAPSGRSAFFIPGCAALSPALAQRLRGAELVLFDGTLFEDDEMVRQGLGTKTGRRMGHMSMAGPEGSMAALAGLGIRRKVYIHINTTNPALLEGTPERRQVEEAGWEVAYDGMALEL